MSDNNFESGVSDSSDEDTPLATRAKSLAANRKRKLPSYFAKMSDHLSSLEEKQQRILAANTEQLAAQSKVQNDLMIKLIELITPRVQATVEREAQPSTSTSNSRNNYQNIALTRYDVDKSSYTMSEWLLIASNIKQKYDIDDEEMFAKVSCALEGRAKLAFLEWKPTERTWPTLVQNLSDIFPRSIPLAVRMTQLCTSRSSQFKTLLEYTNQKLKELNAIHELDFPWEFKVKMVTGYLDDESAATMIKIHRPADLTALTMIMAERDEIIIQQRRLASPLHQGQRSDRRYRQEHRNPIPLLPVPKENKPFTARCFSCNKPGHKASECRQQKLSDNNTSRKTNLSEPCTKCKKPGHSYDTCWFNVGFPSRFNTTKAEKNTKTVLMIKSGRQLEQVPIATVLAKDKIHIRYLLDTGADASLLHDDVARRLNATIYPATAVLTGIGSRQIKVLGTCVMIVYFPQVTIEVTFLVVPNDTLPQLDAIIGWDVINQPGLQLLKTETGLELQYTLAVRLFDIKQPSTPLLSMSGMDEQTQMKVRQLLEEAVLKTPKTVTTGTLTIKLHDTTPVSYRPRPLAYAERVHLKQIIQNLKDDDIISNSCSEYASPVVLVKKKNGDLRLCVDYRDINKKVVKDKYPLPRIQDQIDALCGAKYFTTLDMQSGFHQILIEQEYRHLLAFITPDGHFEYNRMPFGFVNAPACYQRAIDKALGPLKDTLAYVYLDDVLIPSRTIPEGLMRLQTVLTALSTAGFHLNLNKCAFFKTQTEYLGVFIEGGTVKPSVTKVTALVNSPPPVDVKGVRQFMGLAGYFRRFIQGFATKTAAITRLLKKDIPFQWTEECEQIRHEIITYLTTAPVLRIFNPSLQTELYTDASAVGLGGILMQREENGPAHPIAYYSRRTTPCETKYHSYDLETLAVVEATQHFRVYLYGRQFTIFTDCNSLRATALKKELLPRVARWWVKLQDYDFQIQYRPGEKMKHVDYLSRNVEEPVRIRFLKTSEQLPTDTPLVEWQNRDAFCQQLRTRTQELPQYYEVGDYILYKEKCYVPSAARLIVMAKYHDESSHPGAEKMMKAMKQDIDWPGLGKCVRKYVVNCRSCLTGKTHTGKRNGLFQQQEKPMKRMDTWHIDHAGPLVRSHGKTQILVVIDAYTKFVRFAAIAKKDANCTITALKKIFEEMGKPRRIIADRGLAFLSCHFKNFLIAEKVELHHIATGLPRGNGQVERVMRTLFNMLRATLNEKNEAKWTQVLPKIEQDYNSLVNKTTGVTPNELMWGKANRLQAVTTLLDTLPKESRPIDETQIRSKIYASTEAMRQKFNEKRTISKPYYIGDIVVVENTQFGGGKLGPRYKGPFEITACLPNERYAMKRPNGSRHTVAGQEQLRPWPENTKNKRSRSTKLSSENRAQKA